jgi:hypothetical protein
MVLVATILQRDIDGIMVAGPPQADIWIRWSGKAPPDARRSSSLANPSSVARSRFQDRQLPHTIYCQSLRKIDEFAAAEVAFTQTTFRFCW